MEFTPVEVINQIVAWFAVTILELLFIMGTGTPRRKFPARCVAGNILGLIFVMLYFPYYGFARMSGSNMIETALIYIWWIVFYILTILLMRWWFDIPSGQAMLRCIMGMCLYSVGNAVIMNFITGIWLPDLGEEDAVLYLFCHAACYALLGAAAYFILAKNMPPMQDMHVLDTPLVYWFLCAVLVLRSLASDISYGIFLHTLEPLRDAEEYSYIVQTVQYFSSVTSVVLNLFVLIFLFMVYRISCLRQEESMLVYLQSEKEKQYEYSKQNMDVINQKCHDLKRQIQALRFSKDSEREKLYRETQEAADFFDYVVKTDNEMLNTILTEKGLICHNKRIRLTCTVRGCSFGNISTVDLYTMFSNALDNAIECVEKYEDEEKKIISVNISLIGEMNCIIIDNYFDGELAFQGGVPVTSKPDKDYHGFGVRSIQMLAKKYKGYSRISHVNHTFSLQIMLPA